ncbi:hypothetical protein [Actinomyces ruminicola]|uniref:hypothetical protein n=1 Tax=Actinomyces ruminicola TaxID=332524 RepID=UPI0021C4AC71|nr:hypothetical protein [Actinomyces ruminicola]
MPPKQPPTRADNHRKHHRRIPTNSRWRRLPADRTTLTTLTALTAACLALAGCTITPGNTQASPSAPPATAVVPTTAPTDKDAKYTCPGIPDTALHSMFGPNITIYTYDNNTVTTPSECFVRASGVKGVVFYSAFWYVYDDRQPSDEPLLAWGPEVSSFTFDGVEGQGEAHTSSPGTETNYGNTIFTCGDHYLALSIDNASVMAGHMRENLIALTQSALPWLCQNQPIPGLDKTMEQARPYYAYPTPLPSPTPTN